MIVTVLYNPFYLDEPVWLTKKGDYIDFSQMTNEHLRNTIRLLLKANYIHKGNWRRTQLNSAIKELLRRKKMLVIEPTYIKFTL